jgi:hypothetical protein
MTDSATKGIMTTAPALSPGSRELTNTALTGATRNIDGG